MNLTMNEYIKKEKVLTDFFFDKKDKSKKDFLYFLLSLKDIACLKIYFILFLP